MKKDPFNGKIDTLAVGVTKFMLIFISCIFILCGLLFLFFAIFYKNIEDSAIPFLYVFSFLSIVLGITYPLITLHLIRIYPKHVRITRFFINERLFREYDYYYEKKKFKIK